MRVRLHCGWHKTNLVNSLFPEEIRLNRQDRPRVEGEVDIQRFPDSVLYFIQYIAMAAIPGNILTSIKYPHTITNPNPISDIVPP